MEFTGTLEGRQDYLLHGERWARLFFTLQGDSETILQGQLSADAFDADLQPGDPVRVTMLLRTVMEVRHARETTNPEG